MADRPKSKLMAGDALGACARGELAPNVALMRLIMASASERAIENALRAAVAAADEQARPRLRSALALWRHTPGAFATVKSVLRAAEPASNEVSDWKLAFDRVAVLSPEASVALYSLGRRDLLEAATNEIVRHLKDLGLLTAASYVLEIGCGIGRLMPALARQSAFVVGTDLSPAMLRQAAGIVGTNAMLVQISGVDLAAFADRSFDLVLAIDSFPYIVAAGPQMAASHFTEANRVLKPGGALVVGNYSYRGDDELDRREVAAFAAETGLAIRLNGRRELALWDGLMFQLHKPPAERNRNSRQSVA